MVTALTVAVSLAAPVAAVSLVAAPAAAAPPASATPTPPGESSDGAGRAATAEPCDVPDNRTFDTPLRKKPWTLTRMQPERAWPVSRGRGVTVAVIDSGVSTNPEVLSGAVLPGHDYLADGNGTCDQYGHGTIVAAIIAGRDDTGAPFYGVAPDAQIRPYRVLRDERRDDSGRTPQRVADAIRRAVDAHAQVINLSLTTPDTDVVRDAVHYAVAHDVVLVAAAGNEGGTTAQGAVTYPAAYDGVLAVAGINQKGGHVESSNTADYVKVAAPGDRIIGPAPAGGGYEMFSEGGTSFAAPYVSGEAALIRAYNPELSAEQVRQRIVDTADHPPEHWNETVGYGVINPYRSVGAILGGKGAVPDHTGHAAMPAPPDGTDPMHAVRITAGAVAGGLLALALLVFLARRVVPLGRARAWRAGRASYTDGPARPPGGTAGEAAGETTGGPAGGAKPAGTGRVSITAPSSRTNTPAGPGERTSSLPPPSGRSLPPPRR